jgi:hypothetical protein
MCVFHSDRAQKRLINGADGDLRREITLGTLRRPALPLDIVWMVVPLHLETWQRPTFGVIDPHLTRHRKDNCRPVAINENPVTKNLNTLENLGGGDAGGQGEVKAVDLAPPEEMHKTPQRRLGLAGAGFRLEH